MEKQQVNTFEDLSVPKALAKFIVPSVVSQLAMMILNLTDAFCVGRTNDTYQISAMTITFPIVMMITCVATIFGAGGNANAASALGSKNYDRAKQFSSFSVYTAIGVIILLIAGISIFQNQLLDFLGADENSIGFCTAYLFWVYYFGAIPLGFSQVIAQLFIAQGDTQIASIGIAGAGIVNVILDPVFIFGFDMGISGAGCATFIGYLFSGIYFFAMYSRKSGDSVVCLDIRRYSVRNGIALRTLSVGIPAGLSILLMNCCDFIRNALLGAIGGQIELAAWGVVQKVGSAFMQICIGISQGVRPLIAYNYTAGEEKRTQSLRNGSFLIMGVYSIAVVTVANLVPQLLVNMFITVEAAVPTAVAFLRIWIFTIIGISFLELFNSIFQAMNKWKFSMASVVASKVLLMIGMLFSVHIVGIIGIVASQPITEGVMASITAVVFIFFMRNQKRAKEVKIK